MVIFLYNLYIFVIIKSKTAKTDSLWRFFYIIYSRLLSSLPCLSGKGAYLEVKIWSLFSYGNLKTGNKILWKRGENAPKEQFLLFSTIFSINF